MISSTKDKVIAVAVYVAFILSAWTIGTFCLVGWPIEDSKENTDKVIRLLSNGKTELLTRIIYTGYGDDNPYIGRGIPTILTGYYIQDVGTVYWWSDADSVIDAKVKELEAKNKIKW
jgi:hypothetical protein